MYSCGYVAIVGKPNAGKSSLVNAIVGEKVAIVSNKPQTTRNNILGIRTGENYQIILVDTPGIHPTKNHLDKFMMKNVRTALAGVDIIVYLVDGTKKIDEDEIEYIEKLKFGDIPVLVAVTKKDKPKRADFNGDFEISSVTSEGVARLVNKIIEYLPKSERNNFIYDEDEFTNKSMRFIVAENIREASLELLQKEIPHGIAVEVTSFKEDRLVYKIEADIICEKDSHKGIIIGKGGQTLKKIGEKARLATENLLGRKVFLKLFVKVEEGWRNKPNKLALLGYDKEEQ